VIIKVNVDVIIKQIIKILCDKKPYFYMDIPLYEAKDSIIPFILKIVAISAARIHIPLRI
jgi:hypothetical protein